MSLKIFFSADCILEICNHLFLSPPVILTTRYTNTQINNSSLSCFKIHCVQAQFKITQDSPYLHCYLLPTCRSSKTTVYLLPNTQGEHLMTPGQISVDLTRNTLFGNCLLRPIRVLIILPNVLLKLCSAHFLVTMLCSCTS